MGVIKVHDPLWVCAHHGTGYVCGPTLSLVVAIICFAVACVLAAHAIETAVKALK